MHSNTFALRTHHRTYGMINENGIPTVSSKHWTILSLFFCPKCVWNTKRTKICWIFVFQLKWKQFCASVLYHSQVKATLFCLNSTFWIYDDSRVNQTPLFFSQHSVCLGAAVIWTPDYFRHCRNCKLQRRTYVTLITHEIVIDPIRRAIPTEVQLSLN